MKTCFKCFRALELSEFYTHPAMADGHLNKCKQCARADTRERERLKMATDIQWVLSERARHREKTRAARLAGKSMTGNSRLKSLNYAARNPDKVAAHNAVRNAIKSGALDPHPCVKCGRKAQAHHEDYSKPLEVVWLCPKHHAEHHVEKNDVRTVAKFNSIGLIT